GVGPAGGDDALLRRGVVPEVHTVPDRQPGAAPRRRGVAARPRADDAREGGRVARGDGADFDLRARVSVADPGAQRLSALARAGRGARMIAAAPPPTIVAAVRAVYPRSPVRVERICRVDGLAFVRLRVHARDSFVAVE